MKMIVNADDFGKDENSTTAIMESFKLKFINQTTLMVNMPWADRAVELSRANGFFDRVGLHLNFTEGQPLSDTMKSCRVFCGADGCFVGHAPTANDIDEKVVMAIRSEVEVQALAYLKYGLPLLHCDGHHHIQTRLHVAKYIMPVLSKYGFKTIRKPKNTFPNPYLPHFRSRWNELKFKFLAIRNGISASGYFIGGSENLEQLCFYFKKRDCAEIMVHPRYDCSGVLSDITNFKDNAGQPMSDVSHRINELSGK